jgi:orotate phosphoribosyltransferase-like protein
MAGGNNPPGLSGNGECAMECKSENCPIVPWATMSSTDRRAQRQAKAAELEGRGFTEKDIAALLGVNQATISRDLADLCAVHNSKPAKTASNPRGSGRPKGSQKRAKITDPFEARIITMADAGMSAPEIAAEVDIHPRVVGRLLQDEDIRREAKTVADIDPASLSMTAQEKLEAAIRQHKRKLDFEFEARVLAECKSRMDAISLPHYAKELAELERSISSRKGIMDRATYRKILSCLHPDRVSDPLLKKRFEEAFRLFTELEKRVLDEKQSPTTFRKMPRTYEELMAMKRKVQEERRARRTHSNVAQR